ncbi:surface-adhesin E family protein [Allosphingosinicella sp.]|uniref:surface-adhesin E family protein n=1 Tax=Allosphingosinicella sp. TaxID=2823234 RepID=UPI003782DA69
MPIFISLLLAAAQPATATTPAATQAANAQPTMTQPAAPGADWRRLGTSRDRTIWYDAARIERGPEVVTVRFRTELAQAPETSFSTLSRMEIRCAASEGRTIETISYAADGKVIRTDSVPVPFEAIPAGSLMERVKRAAC